MIQEKEIPLFPLNVTLFPHMTLPLHIFEQRYRTMMKDIMGGDKLFGVVLIQSGPEVGDPQSRIQLAQLLRWRLLRP